MMMFVTLIFAAEGVCDVGVRNNAVRCQKGGVGRIFPAAVCAGLFLFVLFIFLYWKYISREICRRRHLVRDFHGSSRSCCYFDFVLVDDC